MNKLIVTTSWDDGSLLDLKLADLLERHGLKGTFYVPKTYSENPLRRQDLITIGKTFEVGAHTLNHVVLTKLSASELEKEIKGSKEYLEYLLGQKVNMFCYPKGYYNKNIKQMVNNAGFVAARTCKHGNFVLPKDPYEWPITLHASNGSPLMTLKIWRESGISFKSLIDWEVRAQLLFDLALQKGGIYHIWGHSWEIDNNGDWDKLERVFRYISKRRSVLYLTNVEIFRLG
jgi:peptidoglycan/xylan/chitin deacetylase (PgdA/CDA1 family)